MKKLIHKIHLETDGQEIKLPLTSRILSCQLQNNRIVMWYEFRATEEHNLRARTISIKGTGIPFEENIDATYIGTVQQLSFVWHIYID
jgi:hypothetical protein